MRSSTSVWSAICGTHFGETKAVASTAGRPASARRSISSTLTAVGTSPRSFCKPSRGPTSTNRTKSGTDHVFVAGEDVVWAIGEKRGLSLLLERYQLGTFEHLLAGGVVDFLHHAVRRRGDRVLHLHRLQDEQRLALAHLG